MSKWNDIVNCINDYKDIVIFTHTNMDGDAMGSASALCSALRKMGKRVVILIEDAIPGYLNIINVHTGSKDELPYFVNEMPYEAKLAIVVDCGDEQRLEKRSGVFKSCEKSICIDHHLQLKQFTDYCVDEPDLAATGLLVYELIKHLGIEIDKSIAEDLYVAIVTDTGRFKYSNTTAYVHEVVAQLYEYGIDHVKLCNAIYDSYPLSQLRAEAYAQDVMEVFADGKAVISYITLDKINEFNASYDQTDTCIDRIRIVEGVEVAAFVKEKEPGHFKVSFRAKNYANVNRIALAFGGGGHEKASGAAIKGTLEEIIARIKEEIIKELSKY